MGLDFLFIILISIIEYSLCVGNCDVCWEVSRCSLNIVFDFLEFVVLWGSFYVC